MTKEERKIYNQNWRSTHKEYMRQYMRQNGHRLRGYKRVNKRWTDELKEEFKRMYTDKKRYHISDIVKRFGISKIAAGSMARKLNVKRS